MKEMEAENKQINTNVGQGQLNDIAFRLVLIPFFGIAIPLITGMVNADSFSHWAIKLSFLYTILIAFVVWQGNRYLMFTMRIYFNWFNKPIKKIVALLLAVSFYTIPVSVIMLSGWYQLFAGGEIEWNKVFTATLIIMICVIFITHVYETVFLVRDTETEMVRNANLEKARAEAELEVLKNQIDPHFLFNSLNTLSHLIEQDPIRAKMFNDNLSDVYRYILFNRSRNLVLLSEEVRFLGSFFELIKLRFGEAIHLTMQLEDAVLDDYLIPPISLQLLVENAIKHNDFSRDQPLLIDLRLENGVVMVSNSLRKKENPVMTSKIGLQNLDNRYALITGRKPTIKETGAEFIVNLPVLKTVEL